MLLRDLEGSGDFLKATWSSLELSWMPLGAFGEGLGGLLGSSWSLLRRSRGPLGMILGPLGAVLGPLGVVLRVMLPQVNFQKKRKPILDQFGRPKGAPKGAKMESNAGPNRHKNRR